MSSTYSTNLRTELIGSGDQAGTWGTTTNGTLGSILEQAIAGVSGGPYVGGTYPAVNFPTDADITLTANNGAVDQSRSAVLVITSSGSLTATRNIIAPASASKVYIIKNATSGGQSIQIKYATGTGVTVGSGQTMAVYGDGTNFYNAETALTNLTVNGTTTLTGVATAPTPTVGDNSTNIATTAFVQGNTTSAVQAAYPVGSIYMNASNSTNPATLLGFGTWSALGAGQMLLGNGGGYTAGQTGGSATTTLSTANLPSHSHSITDPGHTHTNNAITDIIVSSGIPDAYPGSTYALRAATINSAFTGITTTNNTGSGTAVTTISPYLVVYMWVRTV
jgi:hypothetical protein